MHRFLVVGVAALAALTLSSPAGAWTWPADGEVLKAFGLGADPYAGGQHRGIDVAGADGAAIRSPVAGIVTFAGSLPTYGRGVTIRTTDGYAVTLVHLGTIGVEKGASVAEGATIGTMGWSGTPEHAVPSVHLGVRRGDAEVYVDPVTLLPPRSAPVPAPTPTPTPVSGPVPAPAPVSPPTPGPPPPATQPAPSATAPTPPPGAADSSTPPTPAPSPTTTPGASGTPNAAAGQPPTGEAAVPGPGGQPAGSGQAVPRGLTITAATAPPPHSAPDRADAGRPAAGVREAPSAAVGPAGTGGGRLSPVTGREASDDPGGMPSASGDVSPRVAATTGGVGGAAEKESASSSPVPAHGKQAWAPPGVRRGASVASAPPGSAIPGGGAPFGPLLAAFALGCLAAAAVRRRGARRIDRDGAVLPHDADLLRELDPAHRARVHDGGRRRLRPPPAAARS